ncbi:MAG: NAD(P)/FAD-dependent oxidoreductase [Methanomassiliicoccales archaeon]|jgi:geranylgeranyl reductase family protein
MDSDLVVVGGGPVGCAVAAITAERYSTIVLEEHGDAGVPVQCAGLVTARVIDMVGAQDSVLNRITGMVLHFPGGAEIRLDGNETKAVVVDRFKFDQRCKDRAVAAGARYVTGAKFLDYALKENGMMIRADGHKELHCKLLVGADGYKSSVSKMAGLPPPRDMVKGIECDVDHRMTEQSHVHVYLGNKVAPGFFAWKIPCGNFTRLGLCVSEGNGPPSTYLRSLMEAEKLDGTKRLANYSGVIPLGTRGKTYAERLMITGDAAAMAKPLSGGGLFTGMISAECAAATALEALEKDDISERALSQYQRLWKEKIGRELDRGYRVRKVFVRLNDKKLDSVGRLMSKPDVMVTLESGDIDKPTELAPAVLRSVPSLLRFSPQILGSLLFK